VSYDFSERPLLDLPAWQWDHVGEWVSSGGPQRFAVHVQGWLRGENTVLHRHVVADDELAAARVVVTREVCGGLRRPYLLWINPNEVDYDLERTHPRRPGDDPPQCPNEQLSLFAAPVQEQQPGR
jgi:hypothetical protein